MSNNPIVKSTKKQEMASEMTFKRLKHKEELRLKLSKEFPDLDNATKQKITNRVPLSHRNNNKKNNNGIDKKIIIDNNENEYGNSQNTLENTTNSATTNSAKHNKITSITNSNTKSIVVVAKTPIKVLSEVEDNKTQSKIHESSSKVPITINNINKLSKKHANFSSKVNSNNSKKVVVSTNSNNSKKVVVSTKNNTFNKKKQHQVIENLLVINTSEDIDVNRDQIIENCGSVASNSHNTETHLTEKSISIQDAGNVGIFPTVNDSILNSILNLTPFSSYTIQTSDTVDYWKVHDSNVFYKELKENIYIQDDFDLIIGEVIEDDNGSYEESIEDPSVEELDQIDFLKDSRDIESYIDKRIDSSIIYLEINEEEKDKTVYNDVISLDHNTLDISNELHPMDNLISLYFVDECSVDGKDATHSIDANKLEALSLIEYSKDTYVDTSCSSHDIVTKSEELPMEVEQELEQKVLIKENKINNFVTGNILEDLLYNINVDNEIERFYINEKKYDKKGNENELNDEGDEAINNNNNISIEGEIINDSIIKIDVAIEKDIIFNSNIVDVIDSFFYSNDDSLFLLSKDIISIDNGIKSIDDEIISSTHFDNLIDNDKEIDVISYHHHSINNDTNINADNSSDYITSNDDNTDCSISSNCSNNEYVTSNDYEEESDNVTSDQENIINIMRHNYINSSDNDNTSINCNGDLEINENYSFNEKVLYDNEDSIKINSGANNHIYSNINTNVSVVKSLVNNSIIINASKCYKEEYKLGKLNENVSDNNKSYYNLSPCPIKEILKKRNKNNLLQVHNNFSIVDKDHLILNEIECAGNMDEELSMEEKKFRRFSNEITSLDLLREMSFESSLANIDRKSNNCSNSNSIHSNIEILQALKEYISNIDSFTFIEDLVSNEDVDKETKVIGINQEVIEVLNEMIESIVNNISINEVDFISNCEIDPEVVDIYNFQSPIKNLYIDDKVHNLISPIFKSSKERIMEKSNNPIVNSHFIDPTLSKSINKDITSISKIDEIISNTSTHTDWLPFSYEIQLAISTNKLHAKFQGNIERFGYIEFIIKISTRASQRPMNLLIFRRYSDFEDLYYKLFDIYREDKNTNNIPWPFFPSKQYLSSFTERWKNKTFLDERQNQLEIWLNNIINKIAGVSTLYRTALQDFLVTRVQWNTYEDESSNEATVDCYSPIPK